MDLIERKGKKSHRHPWEISRAKSIISLLDDGPYSTIADIGSGDLYFARELRGVTEARLICCDIHYKKDELIKNGKISIVNDMSDIPKNTMDIVFLLDVLEHIEDEQAFLEDVSSLVSSKGTLIITVPAFQCLFGDHDLFLKHFRRYRKGQLQDLLHENNFVVEKIFYFYSSLFLVKIVQKGFALIGIQKKYKNEVSNWPYNRNHFLTKFSLFLLNVDFTINRFLHSTFNFNLPGLSLCAIVKKRA